MYRVGGKAARIGVLGFGVSLSPEKLGADVGVIRGFAGVSSRASPIIGVPIWSKYFDLHNSWFLLHAAKCN
jgi:hypothetical protein